MAKKKTGKVSTNGLNDERFSRIKSDPLFAGLKNSEKKVVIDKRFAAALTDERFSSRAKVDMRGRKQKKTVGNSMLDLYELEENDEKEVEEQEKKTKKVAVEAEDKELDDFFGENREDDADDEQEEEGEDSEDEDSDKEDEKVGVNGFKKLDLARGEGNVESSSDDDSSEDEEEGEDGWDRAKEEMQAELDLANLDRDVDQVEWTSNRLAVCNLEWDNINCEDILMLVKSFTPQDGAAVSVGIYLSDFGKEQLDKEEKTGPLVKLVKPIENYKEDEMDDETRTAVREYLVNKLKYYYAVITFDSVPTAVAVYEECDGFQFEETGLKMDMRFIPDEMQFEEYRVKEFLKAGDVNMTKYKAKKKSKCAITSTGAKIAWDEDDPSRSKKFLQAFNGDEEAGKDLIVDSDESDDEEKRNTLLALLNTDERKSKLDVDWEGDEGRDGSESSDGEYVKVDDDDEEIGVKQKKKKESDDEEEEEEKEAKEEQKLTGYKAFKKKQKEKFVQNKLKRKGGEAETNIKTVAAAESIAKDDRFSALFTDSAFAIEPSSKKFKGSLLVTKQAESKTSGRSGEEQKAPAKAEDLVQKLKARADKWSKKKTSANK
ncbi:unnamed protein product [Caenorhabditis sp. 36 PRJEB53466]|nr:unnamed protein product [Caenorhabditis sp. 36 PRJEB53466]